MKMIRYQDNPAWPRKLTATITVVSPDGGKFGDPGVYRLIGDTMAAKDLAPNKEYATQAECIAKCQKLGWQIL